jgi:hypothetical protein
MAPSRLEHTTQSGGIHPGGRAPKVTPYREDARPAGLSWRRSPIRPAAGGDSATARELFARGYGIEPSRVGGNAFSETARYEALMSAGAADPKDAQLLFQQALCAFCHVTAARERRDSGELLIVSKK